MMPLIYWNYPHNNLKLILMRFFKASFLIFIVINHKMRLQKADNGLFKDIWIHSLGFSTYFVRWVHFRCLQFSLAIVKCYPSFLLIVLKEQTKMFSFGPYNLIMDWAPFLSDVCMWEGQYKSKVIFYNDFWRLKEHFCICLLLKNII